MVSVEFGDMRRAVYDPHHTGFARVRLQPVVSESLRRADDVEVSTTSTTFVMMKEIIIPADYVIAGNFRVRFSLRTNTADGLIHSWGQIRRNGIAHSPEHLRNHNTWQEFTNDLNFIGGDRVQLWIRIATAGFSAHCANFRIFCDDNIAVW